MDSAFVTEVLVFHLTPFDYLHFDSDLVVPHSDCNLIWPYSWLVRDRS